MKKIELDLDALAVDTFETAAPVRGRRGTVQANILEPNNRDWQPSDQSALACATGGYQVCGEPTVTGCVGYTGGDTACCYYVTQLCNG